MSDAAQGRYTAARKALRIVVFELAALVADPNKPDFGPATRNDNTADVECLLKAYTTARAALAKAQPATPKDEGEG